MPRQRCGHEALIVQREVGLGEHKEFRYRSPCLDGPNASTSREVGEHRFVFGKRVMWMVENERGRHSAYPQPFPVGAPAQTTLIPSRFWTNLM